MVWVVVTYKKVGQPRVTIGRSSKEDAAFEFSRKWTFYFQNFELKKTTSLRL